MTGGGAGQDHTYSRKSSHRHTSSGRRIASSSSSRIFIPIRSKCMVIDVILYENHDFCDDVCMHVIDGVVNGWVLLDVGASR